MKIGDYVVATKWRDGDPADHFCVGFFDHWCGDRCVVVDSKGVPFRATGFRRWARVSPVRGQLILNARCVIETSGRSVWWWFRQPLATLRQAAATAKEGEK